MIIFIEKRKNFKWKFEIQNKNQIVVILNSYCWNLKHIKNEKCQENV